MHVGREREEAGALCGGGGGGGVGEVGRAGCNRGICKELSIRLASMLIYCVGGLCDHEGCQAVKCGLLVELLQICRDMRQAQMPIPAAMQHEALAQCTTAFCRFSA